MKVSLKTITPDAEVNIVEIARVSSSRVDKSEKPEGLINYLIRNKHWSPFEHGHMTFEIVTSKVIALQYMRHVSFRFQDFSRRYAVVGGMETIEFRLQADKNRQASIGDALGWITEDFRAIPVIGEYYPDDVAHPNNPLFVEVAAHLKKTYELYNQLLEQGIARECASMILPMAMQTTLYMTGSIRSWIHLMDVRDDAHAQKEAQLIAKEIKKIFIQQLPIISKALGYE